MTVITKPISENKVEKPLEKPLVVSVNDGVGVECLEAGCDRLSVDGGPGHHDHSHPSSVDLWTWAAGAGGSARRRRVSATTTVCVFVVTLVLLTGAIIGGVYVYRQFTHNQMSRFRGWCGVPLKNNTLRLFSHPPVMLQAGASHWPSVFSDSTGSFNEQFDLDLGAETHEEIFVPDFGIGREGHFIHDFKKNLTAIIDTKSSRCFVFPINPGEVVSPRNLYHILRKMWHGFYDGQMLVIRQSLSVVRPPISDISFTGPYISDRCRHFTTYRLEKVVRRDIFRLKRSADSPDELVDGSPAPGAVDPIAPHHEAVAPQAKTPFQQTDDHFTVVEFAGKGIVEYTILDE